jgi:hypothetical protein
MFFLLHGEVIQFDDSSVHSDLNPRRCNLIFEGSLVLGSEALLHDTTEAPQSL